MYIIGNVILGTYAPQEREQRAGVAAAYVATDPTCFVLEEGETIDDLMTSAEQGDDDLIDAVLDFEPWQSMYHGSSDMRPVWVGERVAEFDCIADMDFNEFVAMRDVPKDVHDRAWETYLELPPAVRKVLPPFGLYLVWSSS